MKTISKHIFIPLIEKYRHRSTLKCLGELEKSQWLNTQELQELQRGRLRALIRHAYQNVPYYRRIFTERGLKPEDITSVEALEKLPVLTRQDIRDNFTDLVAQNYPRTRMRLTSTAGSTGEPLKSYHPRDIGWDTGALWRGLGWYGLDMGDKHASLAGGGLSLGIANRIRSRIGQILIGQISHSVFEMSPEQLEHFTDQLIRLKPVYLTGLPSALHIFSRYIMEKGINDIRPKVVVTTAEKLYNYQREVIERAFSCDVFEYYGGTEVGSIAYECVEHQGMHITVENVVLETVKGGKDVSPGNAGTIVVTDLHNYAMPFIRYQNGDLGVLSAKICPCGRGLPLLESVEGRIAETLVIEDRLIPSTIMNTVFKDTHAKQFQVIQESRKLIRVKIVKGEGYSQKDTDHILDTMRKHLGGRIKIEEEFVDSIPLTRSGKHRVVISKVPVNFRPDRERTVS